MRIIATCSAWQTRAVAASLQHESIFAKDCFYVNAMFAVYVRMGHTSSPCERWGHELKLLWDPEKTQPTSGLLHRLHGRLAGLRGNGTDEALLDVVADAMLGVDANLDVRSKPRCGKGRALQSWREGQLMERDMNGARMCYQRDLGKPLAEPGQRLPYAIANRCASNTASKATELEASDTDLLQRIARRDKGWRPRPALAGKAPQDNGSAMPWCAKTLAQWNADLAKDKRSQLTSARAQDFFARRDKGRPERPPEPRAQAAFHAQSSSSGSSDSSSSSSSASTKSSPRVVRDAPPIGGVAHGLAWAHKGGASKIHVFCGAVGFEHSVCHLQVRITEEFTTGLCKTRQEAEAAAHAKWCKHCARIFWSRDVPLPPAEKKINTLNT